MQAVLVGGPWDGHVEAVTPGPDGLPPERIPRFRDTTIWTEDTGHMPVRIPERAYRRSRPDPADPEHWIYEPDVADPLA